MIISKETEDRFVQLLKESKIIVFYKRVSQSSRNFDYKFIGSDGSLRWDFTPMIAEITKCKTNGKGIKNLSCRSYSAYSASYLIELFLIYYNTRWAQNVDCVNLSTKISLFGI